MAYKQSVEKQIFGTSASYSSGTLTPLWTPLFSRAAIFGVSKMGTGSF
jgi:hypothetical protein